MTPGIGHNGGPTIYHVTPITPDPRLIALTGRHFCVSFGYQQQAALMDRVAAGVMFDNGAFRAFTKGHATDWPGYYRWLEQRLFQPGRWAVILDVIAEGGQAQDALLAQWPYGHRGAPVYHTGEPIDRLLRLLDKWPRVCIGSTDDHWRIWLPGLHGKVLDPVWKSRMDEIWEAVLARHGDPVIHMLRGTAVAHLYPFHSADSSSVGQNSHRYKLPLFAGTDEEHIGVVSYADRLESRAAGL